MTHSKDTKCKCLFLLSLVSGVSSLSSPAYGAGKSGFDQFRSTLPSTFNIVSEGGWFALTKRYETEVGKVKFQKYRDFLPDDLDVVAAGGYNNLQKIAADPKAELVSLIVNKLRSNRGNFDQTESSKVSSLVALLHGRGQGFSSVLVDGDWNPVLTINGKKSPTAQKIIGKRGKAKNFFSNFDVQQMTFDNINFTPRGNGILKAVVKYNPVAKNFDKDLNGRIVLRRISCDIVDVSFKYWKLPTLPIPLRKKGGYLDFIYLDEEIRVTRGNRGGLFVHFRPDYLNSLL